ncbi:MAG: hypothetical protein E4H14_05940 [Candidatus Thorarchaeota archaeon]|nr:MAG: hypothetical protein E4H14_05940 [Candidatus Thorarchaeota archaeon]
MRCVALGIIVLLSVATLNLIPISVQDGSHARTSVNENPVVSSVEGFLDEVLLEDNFENAPLGFNDSLWNLERYDRPTLSWIDSSALAMSSKVFTAATLESETNFGPEVIAEFEISFTQGLCYFGIGWVDQYIKQGEEWATNLRACQNGVFMDYIDTEFFLVSYKDGERVATPINNLTTTETRTYSLVWHNSIVSLYVDGVETVSITTHIPTVNLQFILTISGYHYLVQSDTLTIDRVSIGNLEWEYEDGAPDVTLIWPANNSQVYQFDFIDLEIVGASAVNYSWNHRMNVSLDTPWDVGVSAILNGSLDIVITGIHLLDIYAENSTGHSTHRMYMFEIITETTYIPVWDSVVKPVIDGVISNQEQSAMTKYSLDFRGEDRQLNLVDLFIGYFDESLYVGMVTPIPDQWHSHVSLLIDGSGNGIWGDAEVGSNEDIRITASGSTTQNEFRGFYTCTGQEIQITGVTYSTTVVSDRLVVEFFVPVDSVGGNFTRGLGFGMIASRGGYNTYYPVSIVDGGLCTLQIAKSYGSRFNDTRLGYLGSSIILIGFTSLVVGVLFTFKKRGVLTIEESLENEPLERIRTLLQSHPRISLERLALLADLDTQSARELIGQLQRKGLLEDSISVSETEIIRNNDSFEKKNM